MKFKTYSPIDNSVYLERSFATHLEIEHALAQAQAAQKLWRLSSITQAQVKKLFFTRVCYLI